MTSMRTAADDWSAVAAAWDANVDEVDEHSHASVDALLARVDIRAGDRVLELASGPGSLGAALADRTGPTGAVLLSDVAPGMVDVARRRNEPRTNVGVAVLDMTAIDLADATFD